MKTISFTGICPQCTLYDEQHFMRENGKFWECPNCNLQILIENNAASIFRHRGKGIFKLNNNKFNGNAPFQEVGSDSYPNGKQILVEKHLIEYLLNTVEQKPVYSIDKLIDTYENYKFKNGSKDEYLKQSLHFKIDFDNDEIEETLGIRDKEQKLSNQYSTKRMYRFLIDNIFPKYYNSDNSGIPEMGMSQLQLFLSLKHFPNNKRDFINSDTFFIRQALKSLIKDLITIIYEGKEVFLTSDPELKLKIKQEKYDTSLD